MSIFKKKYVGKIGWVDNKTLGIKKAGGHFVYIRSVDAIKNTCVVNTIISLEQIDRKAGTMKFTEKKLNQVKKGNTYPIPVTDASFGRWSGVTKNAIPNIDLNKVQNIGKIGLKRRHKFFIGKYIK